jgi:hypothetical protein
VSESEYQRLRQLTKDIASVEDALTVLGTPFRDEPTPMLAGQPLPTDRYGQPTSPVRILTFSEASEVVDVQVSVKADSTIEVAFGPKYIGPSKGAA